MVKYLLCGIEVLNCASTSDDILISLINDVDTIAETSLKQRENLRMQCFYLKNAYLNAIQYMNIKTWTNCCIKAINFLSVLY